MKLSNNSLESLSYKENVMVPSYDRSVVTSGIMHMSIGGFHRSHQAVYVDDVLALGTIDWGICAVGLMPHDKDNIEKLKQQDTLYSVLERNSNEDEVRVVGSIIEVLHAPSSPEAVLKKLSDSNIKVLSLTVTEKGYCYDSNKNLQQDNEFIQHDLKHLDVPKTVLGYIVSGLKQRKDLGQKPFTVMSCDNLPGNGHLTQKLVLQFAGLVDEGLRQWIEDNVCFPNSMVDRITPVTTDEIIKTVSNDFGIEDQWPVACEDYIQWIVEDNFCDGQHPFEATGVQLVNDVDPYEKMKVRLLNGSHSALSYISYLIGYRDVDKAMADPLISSFVRAYMDHDVTPTLPDVPGVNLDEYKDKLIERFSNTAVSDQVQRLAEDGSQKIPNAILPCILHQLRKGGSTQFLTIAMAGWFRYLTAIDEQGDKIDINDPLADQLVKAATSKSDVCQALLSIKEIFGEELVQNSPWVEQLDTFLSDINEIGAKAFLQREL